MNNIIDKDGVLEVIASWDSFLNKKVRLIACGGTALTLLGLKASTKDVDLMVPDVVEHEYLVSILKQLGYSSASGWGWSRHGGFIFDLFRGKSVHTTELLESPLASNNHMVVKEFSKIYLGVLNYYDIIISKIFRGTSVDMEDCLLLVKSKRSEIDLARLSDRFKETASFDVSENVVLKNFEHFVRILKKEGVV